MKCLTDSNEGEDAEEKEKDENDEEKKMKMMKIIKMMIIIKDEERKVLVVVRSQQWKLCRKKD